MTDHIDRALERMHQQAFEDAVPNVDDHIEVLRSEFDEECRIEPSLAQLLTSAAAQCIHPLPDKLAWPPAVPFLKWARQLERTGFTVVTDHHRVLYVSVSRDELAECLERLQRWIAESSASLRKQADFDRMMDAAEAQKLPCVCRKGHATLRYGPRGVFFGCSSFGETRCKETSMVDKLTGKPTSWGGRRG